MPCNTINRAVYEITLYSLRNVTDQSRKEKHNTKLARLAEQMFSGIHRNSKHLKKT